MHYLKSTLYNIIRWFTEPMGQKTRRPSIWRSKYFFFTISYRLVAFKILYFHFCNFIKKINWKDFCKEFCKKSWKKIILEKSDAWLTIRLSHRPRDPAYYIVNWRIFDAKFKSLKRYVDFSKNQRTQPSMKSPNIELILAQRTRACCGIIMRKHPLLLL